MDYLSEKVSSFTGEALTSVNEMRRKWKSSKKSGNESQDGAGDQNVEQQQQQQQSTSAIYGNSPLPGAGNSQPLTNAPRGRHNNYTSMASAPGFRSPLAGGIPFGGDSYTSDLRSQPPAPPIGFRTDLLKRTAQQTRETSETPDEIETITSEAPGASPTKQPNHQEQFQSTSNNLADSSESLYEADAWARLWFPRVMILCLLRMLLFIRKVYEDFHATKVYNLTGQTGFLLISATTLFLPTLVFTLYRIARYLQLALPELRLIPSAPPDSRRGPNFPRKQIKPNKNTDDDNNDEDSKHLTRALMTSSPESTTAEQQQQLDEDAGLVTARQSPANQVEEFHDASQQLRKSPSPGDVGGGAAAAVAHQPQQQQQKLESLNVDKLGDLPDRETVRIVLGASEQFLHGILFVFWQLKRQVDVLGYLVERACLWRKPADREKQELDRLRTGSDGLEWFQDFYAAFLAILAQVFMLSAHNSTGGRSQLAAATSASAGGGGGDVPHVTSPGEQSTSASSSSSLRILGSFFGVQALASGDQSAPGGRDVLLVSELVISSAVVLSLLLCVRRHDDGPLTLGLSMLGWGSLFAARVIAISLAFVHIGWHIMLPLLAVHVLAITCWIYSIALASHNDAPSERHDEAQWDEETALERQQATTMPSGEIELDETKGKSAVGAPNEPPTPQELQQQHEQPVSQTGHWSILEHLVLLTQILILFSVPSLFYWPIMFNLKLHLRPFKYLVLILMQNFLLVPAIWMAISGASFQAGGVAGIQQATPGQLYLLGSVGAFSIVGFIFVSLYVACKPSLTEYFARADELFNEAEQSGIYYEFCSRVFKLPDLSKETFRRLMNQSEVQVVDIQQ